MLLERKSDPIAKDLPADTSKQFPSQPAAEKWNRSTPLPSIEDACLASVAPVVLAATCKCFGIKETENPNKCGATLCLIVGL